MTPSSIMNVSPNRLRRLLILMVALGGLGAVAALILFERARTTTALRELRREAAELREQLEARDTTISSLQIEVQQLRRGALVANGARTSSVSPVDMEWARRVTELTLQQSNTAVIIERLLARTADAPPPAVVAQRREAALTALEASVQEEQQKLEAAKQRAAELLISLNIPADVSTMDAAKALDTASLRAYWPYFEAKRERDSLQYLAERFRLRLMQEQLDARIEAAK